MIIAQIRSGLGNQLFQYAVARQLAFLNRDELKLDTAFFESQTLRSYGLKYFQVSEPLASRQEVEDMQQRFTGNLLVDKLIGMNQEYLPKKFRRHYLESADWQYEPGFWQIRGNVYLEGYWQHHKYFDGFNYSILDSLRLRPGVRSEYAKEFSIIERDEQSVSLHLRRGDYLSDPGTNEFIGVLPISYYQQALNYLRKYIADPHLYIFSDDLNWARDHLQLNASMRFMEIGNGRQEYIELELMSECRHNIIANSSFSWWAAFLNRHPGRMVISPSQWVRKEGVNEKINIQMPGWLKI